MVLKKIKILDFIESIENIVFLLWFLYLLIICTLSLLFCKNFLMPKNKQNKKKKNYIISFILSFSVSLIPIFVFESHYGITTIVYSLIPFVLPGTIFFCLLLIYIKSKIKLKK